jgi:hypothetical protein
MENQSKVPFSLFKGGPYYRLITAIRIVREGSPQRGRIIPLFVLITWVPLFFLSLARGTAFGDAVELPFLYDTAPYARLLVAVPIFILAERWVDARLTSVTLYFHMSDLIPKDHRPQWETALREATGRRDSILFDLIPLVFALVLPWILTFFVGESPQSEEVPSSWFVMGAADDKGLTPAGFWYVGVGLALFQFLIFRWIGRFYIWLRFLRALSKIPLVLEPTHPDLAGGLGILGRGQLVFTLFFLGIGVSLSGLLSQQILYLGMNVLSLRNTIMAFVITSLVIVLAPLLLFTGKLIRTKQKALREYGILGKRLSDQFDNKWVKSRALERGNLLETADSSALADYGAAYEFVKHMRPVPIEIRNLILPVVLLLLPFVPLVFMEFSVKEIFKGLMDLLA